MAPRERSPEIEKFMKTRESGDPSITFNRSKSVREHLSPALRTLAEEVNRLGGQWNPIELVTADAGVLAREKATFLERFSRGETYQPVLSYPAAEGLDTGPGRKELLVLMKRILAYQPADEGERLAKIALHANVKDSLATLDLVDGIKARDEKLIKRAVHQKYPKVDDVLLSIAQREYEGMTAKEKPVENAELNEEDRRYFLDRRMKAEEIAEAFSWALDQYGLLKKDETGKGYTVIIDESATAIDVRDKSAKGPIVVIPKDREDTAAHILSLIAHEIDGHARQHANGDRLFGLGRPDDESLYEGLSQRHEEAFMKRYFGKGIPLAHEYVIGIDVAEKGGTFHDVFTELLERELHVKLHVPPDEPLPDRQSIKADVLEEAMNKAWRSTYRVMRGHTDMSNPERYAMRKDAAYLRGFHEDRQLRERGYGYVNEAAIIGSGGLQLLARTDLQESDLPLPFQDTASKYLDLLQAQRKAAA